ncbi:MAG: PAS domain-containing protein, partial [bacterium]
MEDTTLKVLIVHDEKAEANRLISLLRNANYKPEAKHTDQDDVLSKLLQERPWDIALCQMQGTNLPAKTLFSQIRRQNLDLPVILIIDEYDPTLIVEGLRQGAADVVVMDHDQHILQVISRSLQNLNSRRLLRRWKNKFNDSEKRAERLLHNSRNAIAIVQEGTFLYANDSYARMLGHPDGDSLTCLPVIDTVADGDQEGLMPYLRHIESDDVYETREIAYTAMTESGSPVPLRGIVSMVEFEGEPALEFMVPMNPAEELNGESTALASASSIQLNVLFETIAGAIRKALQHISKAALL